MPLHVSSNRRFLVTEDGSPFFYLADTAWELFYRLDAVETQRYLAIRAAQEFTVIQSVLLSEFGELERANRQGSLPLHDKDPMRPNEAFFAHVDIVVDQATSLGLWMGLLPTWADKVGPTAWGTGPVVFTRENAYSYGLFLGQRYADKPVIWILGGDRLVETDEQRRVWRALAEGIRVGDGGRGLMTFHPPGGHSSADLVGEEAWLDFSIIQTSHGARDAQTYQNVEKDYRRLPIRPTMEAEFCYENHPVDWKPELGRFSEWDVRKGLYWSLFAGGHGFTYGCNDIFSFYRSPEDLAIYHHFTPILPWEQALYLPGARQMKWARRLLLSRPSLTRIPDQTLLAMDPGEGANHMQATRDSAGTYAFVYTASGLPVTINRTRLASCRVVGWWYDPRTGAPASLGEIGAAETATFTPPSSGSGQDWVLVLDAGQDYPPPGMISA